MFEVNVKKIVDIVTNCRVVDSCLDTKSDDDFPGRTYCPFISKIPDLIKIIADLFEKYYEPESSRNV